MVTMDKGMPVQAIRPNVHVSAMETEVRGSRKHEILRNRHKRIIAIRINVIGGNLEKSSCVKLASA